jgi:amidase
MHPALAWRKTMRDSPRPGLPHFASSGVAISGYLSITAPVRDVFGMPLALSFIGGEFSDQQLIRFNQAGYSRKPPSVD